MWILKPWKQIICVRASLQMNTVLSGKEQREAHTTNQHSHTVTANRKTEGQDVQPISNIQ